MPKKEEDHKDELLERMASKDVLDEKIFEEAVKKLAFLIEDELRADIRFHYIDSSMWRDIVMPFAETADYEEIARSWLTPMQGLQKEQKNA